MLYDLPAMKKRLAEIDAERGPLVTMIEAAEAYEATIGGAARTQARHAQPQNSKINEIVANSSRRIAEHTASGRTLALALEMIEARNAPVPTRDVVAEMEKRGLPLPAKNHLNVISARLSNHRDKLKGRRDMGWWPVNRPWPDEVSTPDLLADGGRKIDLAHPEEAEQEDTADVS